MRKLFGAGVFTAIVVGTIFYLTQSSIGGFEWEDDWFKDMTG